MPLPNTRRGRSQYNPISSTEDDSHHPDSNDETSSTTSRRRRDNNGIGTERISKEDTPLKSEKDDIGDSEKDTGSTYENDDGERITIVILDSAQKKFPIPANPDWTVEVFKNVSSKTHKVPPASQRLIFRGKMLDDTKTLHDSGIKTDNLIVHLFPKPRVVVTSSSNVTDGGGSAASTNSTLGDIGAGGAHVPQIVLDEEEQQRRGQILVLGSAEIAEAQNNVKLLSLLLLVVCAMRLMALFSIAMGVAEQPIYYDDDVTPPSGNHTDNDGTNNSGGYPDQYEVRPWEIQDYFDLAVSAIGFYVATLGMKATTENTLRLATAYLVGTVIAGIAWNLWNGWMYMLFVQQETTPNDDYVMIPLTRDDFVTVAFFTVMIPLGVWWMCCLRAWQFRMLISEAELEAAERIQSQLRLTEGVDDDQEDNFNGRELTELSSSNIPIV